MAKKPRVTRKQLLKEPDEFITFTGKMIQWTKTHRNQLIIAAGVVILIAAGLGVYLKVQHSLDNRAFSRLDEALNGYEQLKATKGTAEAFKQSEAGFEKLVQQSSGRSAGLMTAATVARLAYQAQAYQKAVEMYGMAIDQAETRPMLQMRFLSSLGHSYLKLGDRDQAIAAFQRIADMAGEKPPAEALFMLGMLRIEAGEKQKGRQLLEKLIAEQPGSLYYPMAQEQLAG